MKDALKHDPESAAQRIEIEGVPYVLVREKVYENILEQIESLDAALDAQRNRTSATQKLAARMMSSRLTRAQAQAVNRAPTFGRRMEALREIRHLSQFELAERTGLSQATISKLENDQVAEPGFDSVHRILRALEAPAEAAEPLLDESTAKSED